MMKHYTLYIYRTLLLLALLSVGGAGEAWGQQTPPEKPTDNEIKNLLRDFSGQDASSFMQMVDNETINFIIREEQDIRDEATWVYDIVWTIEEDAEIESSWPNEVGITTSTNYSISSILSNPCGNGIKEIYATSDAEKTLTLQDGDNPENLDGYIRWYVTTSPESNTGNATGLSTGSTILPKDRGKILTFQNGLAWLRGTHKNTKTVFKACLKHNKGRRGNWYLDNTYTRNETSSNSDFVEDVSPSSISKVKYHVPEDATPGSTYYVICEASTSNKVTSSGRTVNVSNVAAKYVHKIHVINKPRINAQLTETSIPVSDETQMAAFHQKFLEYYEIYTPLETGTNYRLEEPLANYYIPSDNGNPVSPTKVRWSAYKQDGSRIEGYLDNTSGKPAILKHKFDTSTPGTYYLIAEVAAEDTYYPVSLLKVNLIKYAQPYTQGELNDLATSNSDEAVFYEQRLESYLMEHNYERVDSITFDEGQDDRITKNNINVNNNFRTTPLADMNSYYAFAGLADVEGRKGHRLSSGRGEYGVYRTLNVENISKGNVSYNRINAKYNDYFANYYNKQVYDRWYEKTTGRESGYFMYLDATDDPGIITTVQLEGLCRNTSLAVSAWICDLAESPSVEHADVGFTLKRRGKDGAKDEILTKYYTGFVSNKPTHGNNNGGNRALWQQVFFKFSFPEGEYDDTYILEIANNTPSSAGADYAIDEIKIFKSTPAITAQREDACSASVLVVSSDYETLQKNMSWDINPNVIDENDLSNPAVRKYRYGMMGDNPYAPLEELTESNVGNVYFAFTEIEGTGENETVGGWIVVNRDLQDEKNKLGLEYAIRVAVQTDMNTNVNNMIPTTREEALHNEVIMNVRAMNDFLEDVKREDINVPNTHEEHIKALDTLMDELCRRVEAETTDKVKGTPYRIEEVYADRVLGDPQLYTKYEKALLNLYTCLEIPRIRCPWRSEDNTILYLSEIDVYNTDLRFANELIGQENGKPVYAKGEYFVILFSAKEIGKFADPDEQLTALDLNSKCALKKKMFVVPSISIKVDTDTEATGVTCVGEIHTLHAQLQVADVDQYGNVVSTKMKSFEDTYGSTYQYTFDWFLGSKEEADKLVETVKAEYPSLQTLIAALRNQHNIGVHDFTVEDVNKSNLSTEAKRILTYLLSGLEPRLVFGKDPSFRWVKKVVAMPYVTNKAGLTNNDKLFCTNSQELTLNAESNVPELNVGFPYDYPQDIPLDTIPLRLGLGNITSNQALTIPIQKAIKFGALDGSGAVIGKALKATSNKQVMLRKSNNSYMKVATLNSLLAVENGTENKLSLTFQDNVASHFKEGETYALYVPFGEYESAEAETPIEGSCEGYAYLLIKIVPEYLTWQGDASKQAVWYNDTNWKQSTEAELYKGQQRENVDANGTDNVANAFAPLYFTKITIPGDKTLPLEDQGKLAIAAQEGRLNLDSKAATDNIEYDMAVNNTGDKGAIKIVPYYGNKVSEIYFKPEARLQRQQYLTYDTARVEFNMTEGQKYWMASPLQAVFAGDMYAPEGTARQTTDAFAPIFYSGTGNDRQNPSFYQKAWDKGVTVYTDAEGNTFTPYGVVKSNWSVEYNDVNVPYALGKGFYASVEDIDGEDIETALVRLPKADKGYTYEELKAKVATIADRQNAGKLAGSKAVTIVLADVDTWVTTDGEYIADGNNTVTEKDKITPGHFLLGNPYMYPLDMAKFLQENSKVLAQKYWTLSANGSATVGTPDLGWDGEQMTGTIPPMQAFFVELAANVTAGMDTKVTFAPGMMEGEDEDTPSTRSAITASAPVLRLTAEKGDKRSIAYLTQHDEATNKYDADKDAITLLDSELAEIPQVYTVAGDRAAGVNAVKEITNIPLGVYTDSAQDEVTLTIEGANHFINTLYLYDAQTRKSQALTGDSHTLHLTGSSHGRYFLRSSENPTGNEAISTDAISIYSAEAGKVIVSATAPLTRVRVVSLSGQVIRSLVPNQPVSTVRLPKGIYIIHAESNGGVKTEKVIVR